MTKPTTESLIRKKCVPCEGGVPKLTADEIKNLLPAVPGWTVTADGKRLHREWRVKDFTTGLEFFRKVGAIAEAENHHPDLHLVGYREATIELSTHAIGGLSENDFILAAKIGEVPVKLKQ